MSDIQERLAKLSPEKRKLLQELLARERGAPSAAPPRAASNPALLSSERFTFSDEVGLTDKETIRDFYNTVSSQLDASPFAEYALFLNYGYVPNSNPQHARVKLPDSTINKNATRLILEVIGACELRPEHDVLDVGCGRGGTCFVLRNFFQIRQYLGVDLSPTAIAHCERVHRWPDTRFVVGDAEQLPVGDASFDAVINIESSHCYGDLFAFYREVHRALRPGGWFLYTDLIGHERVAEVERFLSTLGFQLEDRRDITSNVILSCDETAATHARAFHQGNDRGLLGMFLGEPSSRIYDAMKNGLQKYMLYRFRKNA